MSHCEITFINNKEEFMYNYEFAAIWKITTFDEKGRYMEK